MPRGFKTFEEFESGKYVCLEDLKFMQITYAEN